MANEIQRATADALIANIESGGIAFYFNVEATASIDWDDLTSANVQAALEALSGIGAGNVMVTDHNNGGGSLIGFTITFQGALANAPQVDITVDTNTLKAGASGITVVAEATAGAADVPTDISIDITRPAVAVGISTTQAANTTDTPQIDTITVGTISAGAITIDGQSLAFDADASTLTFANFTGSGTPASGTITLTGVDFDAHDSVTVAGVQEQQTISFSNIPTGGQWKIFTGGAYEATLDTTATASDLITIFNGVPDYSVTTITGNYTTGFVVTYDDELSAPHPPPSFDDLTLAVEGEFQVATVTIDDSPDEGTLKVTVNGVVSDAFAYSADASAVNTALTGAGIAFTASGNSPSWTLTANARAASVTVTAAEDTPLRKAVVVTMSEVQEGSAPAAGGGLAFWNLYGSCANV